MKTLRCVLFLIFVIAGGLSAQEPVVTSDTPVEQSTLRQWLHSADPRLIAWGADFARRNHDAKLIAEMPSILEHWTMPPDYGGDETQAAQRRAVLAMLDALIQENANVPVSTIQVIASTYPSQAAILIGRLPLSASRNALDDWTYAATGTGSGRTLARIASMMLAKDPVPSRVVWNQNLIGFVASVVDASEDNVHISVRADNSVGFGSGTGVCGDSLGHKLTPGWPQVYTYGLDEANERKVSEQVVVDLDGDQIFLQRFKENEGRGSCGVGVEALNPSTRHRLLAHWLGTPEREMSWQPIDSFTIVWTNSTAYRDQLGKIIESERLKLYDTVESLRHRGLLRGDEEAMPRLVVTIQCDIKPCPLQ
jgi:hypothetical protein